MSEDEFFSEDSYEFEFEEDDEDADDNSQDVVERGNADTEFISENKYLEAKNYKYEDPQGATRELLALISKLDDSPHAYDWIFKSYKQLVKINVNAHNYDDALRYLKKLASAFAKVNGVYAEESLVRMINNYSASTNSLFVSAFYDTVLMDILPVADLPNQDRIRPRISLNKLNALLDANDFAACQPLMNEIKEILSISSDATRKTYALEFIAAEMTYHSHVDGHSIRKLSELYRKSTKISSAVTHPRILGRIQESGAIIQFYRGNYQKARLFFYECFNNYDDVGSVLKRKILKYLALCSMLMGNELNPFASQETRAYAELAEFQNLLLLIRAFDSVNVKQYCAVLDKMDREKDALLLDGVFKLASVMILRDLRRKQLVQYLGAFKRVSFSYLVGALGLAENTELEAMFHELALSGGIGDVKIDFVNEIAYSSPPQSLFDVNLAPIDFYRNVLVEASIGIGLHVRGNASTSDRAESSDFKVRQLAFVTEKTLTGDWWVRPVEDLMNASYSAIPHRHKGTISQKDQIELNQKAENSTRTTDPGASKPIQPPAPSNSDEFEADSEHGIPINKAVLLKGWCAALKARSQF